MLLPIFAATFLTLLIAFILAVIARIRAILPPNRAKPIRRRYPSTSASAKYTTRSRRLERAARDVPSSEPYPYGHILLVLGSGGHTAEMLLMLEGLGMTKWKRRTWAASGGDGFSSVLAVEFERRLTQAQDGQVNGDLKTRGESKHIGEYEAVTLPRARRVHQSLLTAPWTSLVCLWAAVKLLRKGAPDIILTNGPGTGVIIVLASLILRFFDFEVFGAGLGKSDGAGKTRIVYVESLARCRRLSLSGRLLRGVVDRFLVQWPDLEGEFRGTFALDATVEIGMNGVGEAEMAGKMMEFNV